MKKSRALFVDRDGVINRKMPDGDYVKDWSEFIFLPGALKGLRILNDLGYSIILVTNQRCVARKIITEEKLRSIHARLSIEAEKAGAVIDRIYYCPHDLTDNCACRKPRPGMISRAIRDFEKMGLAIDRERSFMIGDEQKDIEAGKAAGLRTIKIGSPLPEADLVCEDLYGAAIELSLLEKSMSGNS